MLYNTKLNKVKEPNDCVTCAYFDRRLKKCNGLNKICFEYDAKTQTIIDGNTKLPRRT